MTLKRSRGGYKAALTQKKKQIESHKRQRFPRTTAQEKAKQIRYWIESDQLIWDSALFNAVIEDAKKQGFHA